MSVPRAHRWDIVKALPLVLAVLAGLGLLSRHRHSPRAAVADLAPVEVVAVVIASNGYTANYTINTLLTAGRWEGPIYVVGEHCERRVAPGEADAAGCASETWQRPDLLPAGAPSRALGAKAIKTRLLDVAVGAKRVLYLDSDILVRRAARHRHTDKHAYCPAVYHRTTSVALAQRFLLCIRVRVAPF